MNTSWKPLLISVAGILLFVGALVLMTPSPAAAQCGSQASSCKNCHEVQGQLPVNAIGDWHVSHAFGDFCQFCHAGNVQAMEAEPAHQGMVAPLADPVASCGACHPTDAHDLAVVYGSALGVEVGAGSGAPAAALVESPTPTPSAGLANSPPPADVIDYNAQYAESVEGQGAPPIGNLILGALIAVIVLGGGGYVLWNERRRRQAVAEAVLGAPAQGKPKEDAALAEGAPHLATRAAQEFAEGAVAELGDSRSAAPALRRPAEGAPASALLSGLGTLDPLGRRGLEQLLRDPETASQLFHRLARLDPDMLRALRNLDQNTRELLLALSKD